MKSSVGIVILAAGYARRMGRQKLMLPYGEQSMLRHVVKKAMGTEADWIVVVINSEFPNLFNEVNDLPVHVMPNHESRLGMSSSLRLGFAYLSEVGAEAGLVLLADQPGMESSVIDQVIQRYTQTKSRIVQAVYQGKPGHPVLFSGTLFDELQEVSGDQGGRQLIAKYAAERELVWIDTDEPEDIDTLEDYQRVIQKGGSGN
ncbi:nucleotidyltransferase family protein [Brevibacillus agri]|uniref:nucleotidyltransferase family protein n=1 Tax=Brevibacillus agri TaxID=51101 RepID=UPI002E214FFC|nr:nucleotidyltransferase family protein [Brevibacillus agri]MED1657207.1 nucleotidyltransferase family protein [Brevibacillus agri]MED1689628.1 nucleotidyltransferase family protein [Brevibacillus agri]MED1693914.1 nucleotidyltransferase family protein [Brevibacillus agri]MED1698290.1 nucleotidyltransferase family protein [Brevibacillus agri]